MHPKVYADLLGEKVEKHSAQVWLINTGWTGGPYGEGHRMKLAHTRRMVEAAITGELDQVELDTEPFFGLHVPVHIEGVPDQVLRPQTTWPDAAEYDKQAKKLSVMFRENFEQFAAEVDPAITAAGPEPD
jgi:phosphoenolpyruvate carboxykinase (ATP)